MTFFYDLNKKLDSIRATPEVKTQQLNEQASPLSQIINERATGDYSAVKAAAGKDIGKPGKNFSKIAAGAAKRYGSKEAGERVAGAVLNKLRHPKEGMGFLGEKEVDEAHNPNSVGAENRRGLDASHEANLKKKAAAGDAKAQAALQHLKNKKERMSNDFNAGMERESAGMDESALQAAFGIKKYGKPGMEKLQQLGREGASEKTKTAARKKFNQYDEGMDEGSKPDFLDIDKDGNTTEPMKSAARGARGKANSENVGEDVEDSPHAIFNTINKYKEALDPQQQQEFQQVLDKIGDPVDDGRVAYRKNSERVFDELKRFLIANQVRFDPSDFNIVNYKRRHQGTDEGVLDTVKSAVGLGKKPPATTAEKNAAFHAANKGRNMPSSGNDKADYDYYTGRDKVLGGSGIQQVNKITFADKIVGAKKAVDEMLGDVAADAMKKAVRGRNGDMEEESMVENTHSGVPFKLNSNPKSVILQLKDMGLEPEVRQFMAWARDNNFLSVKDALDHATTVDWEEFEGEPGIDRIIDGWWRTQKLLGYDGESNQGGGRGRDRDMEEASTGNAFDYKNFKQPEKQKPTSFVHKGTYGTEYDGDKEDARAIATKKQAAVAAGQASRGRGRPKNNASADTGEVMKPDFSAFGDKVKLKPHAGKITKHKMVGENDIDPKDQGEYDQEGRMAKDDIKTVVRHAQALEKILGDNDNLPEWVQAKLAKIEGMMTAVDDYMQNQQDNSMGMDSEEETIDERSVSKAQVKTMGAAAHNPKFAKKVGIKPAVAKEFNQADKGKDNSKLPEKAAKKTKEVDETTSSGSVATSGAAPKAAKGMSYGKGIYDSLNRKLEGMISESMNISMNMSNDSHGGPTHSLTVTATDEDAMALASMLRMAGMGGGRDHMPHMNNGVVQPDNIKVIDFDDGTDDLAAELSNELHSGHDSDHSETCPTCGSSDCGCNSEESMDEAYGDTDATENHPDYPTDPEGSDDAMMYSGGIDGPKSTGQSTVPVIASQQDRQHAYEDDAALRRMMEMSGISEAKDNKEQSDKKECPPMSHVKKMCQDGMSTAEICKMHPDCDQTELKQMVADCKEKMDKAAKELNEADAEFNESIQRMREIAGLPVAEAAPPVKLATPQAVDEPVSPASAAATPGKKPVVKPATKLATPQDVPEPVKEDQMAKSLMRELHNFKY